MKRILAACCCLLLCLSIFYPYAARAAGDGNMDGGGGSTGSGTASNFWNEGNDGCRVTVVTTGGREISQPIDFTNRNIRSVNHFGKVSKFAYQRGAELQVGGGTYTYYQPTNPLPKIVKSTGGGNIEVIKRYWCSEYAAQMLSDLTGISYSDLISGDYKVLVEPIAYMTINGSQYCMTATEAALYDIKSGGHLRKKMTSVTHKNLPLSIFLEKSDLGIQAWTGPKNKTVTNEQILSTLGVGIVSYTDQPAVDLDVVDYEYRVDTDVISSITLYSDGRITPDNPATVTFTIAGRNYRIKNIVLPANSSQVVWVKWHTPSTPQTVPIRVKTEGGYVAQANFQAKIVSLDENRPPDPQADDTKPGYTVPSVPNNAQKTTAAWIVWYAYWNWDSGWEFAYDAYSAHMRATMTTRPDDVVPTASGRKMKSGYGIKTDVEARMTTNAPENHYSTAQTVVTYFPEFQYQTYWRLLDRISGSLDARFQFKENEYSTKDRRVHFLPVWFPDNKNYTLYGDVWDAWTPDGMLSVAVKDYVEVQSNVFDDWYTNRG